MIRLMVADSSQNVRRQLSTYFNAQPGMRVVAVLEDGAALERALHACEADVLIMDLTLSILDGLEIMRRISIQPESKRPHIIVLSCIVNDQITAKAMQLGASYYMVKPCDVALLKSRIYETCVPDMQQVKSAGYSMRYAGQLLLEQGISGNSKGKQYLCAALESALSSPDDTLRVTKWIYPEVARCFGTQPHSVERAIRSSIESAWTRGAMQCGGWFEGVKRPTNGEFLARLINEVATHSLNTSIYPGRRYLDGANQYFN